MFLPDLNTRQIKKADYHTIHIYEEQTRIIRGRSSGRGSTVTGGSSTGLSGPAVEWFDDLNLNLEEMSRFDTESQSSSESQMESESEVAAPVFVPIPIKELASETEWSREEKVSRVAEMLKFQQQRHCFIKLDTEKTQPLKVPFVRDFGVPEQYVHQFERSLYDRQGALPAAEADRLIAESQRAFVMDVVRPDVVPIEMNLNRNGGENDEDLFR